jgi:ATP-dependent DNA helicase PIF1
MGGITIHSWAGIGIMKTATDKVILDIAMDKRIAKRMQKTKTLIIDEISMLDADRLDLVEKVARHARGSWAPFGGMQVVLCGDFFQLPPVSKAGEPAAGFAYKSGAWQNMNLKVCYLHEQHRQGDKEFLKLLMAIRDSAVDEAVTGSLRQCRAKAFSAEQLEQVVKLYSHNQDVDTENEQELAKIRERANRYTMKMEGIPAIAEALKDGCLAPEKLVIKKGAAVMFVKNAFDKGYVNGSLGTVSDFSQAGFPVVTLLNGNEILAEPATWEVEENSRVLAQIRQIPLRLAWSITVHKSQGMTLDAAQVDLSKCFEKGMGYVALSRVRSLDGLRVLGFNDMALRVSEEVQAFDKELKKLSEEALRESAAWTERVIEEVKPAEIKPKKKKRVRSKEKSQEKSPEMDGEKVSSKGKRWTEDEEARLAEGFKEGKSIAQLAEMLGRGYGGVSSRLAKLGLIEPGVD